jgi:Na+/serine symporter
MQPDQIREFYNHNFYYILVAQILIGLVLGVVPFILGRRRGKRNLGLIGLILCVITGAVSPLLGLLVCVGFSIAILVKGTAATPNDSSGN